jgi:cell wall assembly regulator SMI1
MNTEDIKAIEAQIGIALPEFYRATMTNYPFPNDSFADEFLLPNSSSAVIANNEDPGEYPDVAQPFVIGGDGGEEIYFVDLAATTSQVFVYDMDTGKHTPHADDWAKYLDQIANTLKEIEEDEQAETERKANKKWWEFWK